MFFFSAIESDHTQDEYYSTEVAATCLENQKPCQEIVNSPKNDCQKIKDITESVPVKDEINGFDSFDSQCKSGNQPTENHEDLIGNQADDGNQNENQEKVNQSRNGKGSTQGVENEEKVKSHVETSGNQAEDGNNGNQVDTTVNNSAAEKQSVVSTSNDRESESSARKRPRLGDQHSEPISLCLNLVVR